MECLSKRLIRLPVLVTVFVLSNTQPGLSDPAQDLNTAVASFNAAPSSDTAAILGERILNLGSQGDWDVLAAIDLTVTTALIGHLPPDLAAEVLLFTAQAEGLTDQGDDRQPLIALSDRFANIALSDDQKRVFDINLGYVLVQTGDLDQGVQRLDRARQMAEAEGRAEDLLNLCGLASNTLHRVGAITQAAAFYDACAEGSVLNQTPLLDRGFFWHNYALFLRDQGSFDLAVEYHVIALTDLADVFGLPSPQVVDAYDGMSQTLLAKGDLGGADSVASLALGYSEELGQQQTQPAHWRVVNNAAAIKRALRRPRQALDLDEAAYVWRKEHLGEAHPMTYASWLNYALDLVELEQWEDALPQFVGLYRRIEAGEPVPYNRRVITAYLLYIDARQKQREGAVFKMPSVGDLVRDGAPGELIEGLIDLSVQAALAKDDLEKATETAKWLSDFMVDAVPPDHPAQTNANLRHAELLARQDPKAAADLLVTIDRDLFNWTRRQALSGSYDASIAARALTDDLLLTMVRLAETSPAFQPHVAEALHRWKTLEAPTDRALRDVVLTASDQSLGAAARDYLLAAGRFQETVRAEPVTDAIAIMDQALTAQRVALNERLQAAGLQLAEPPLAPLEQGASSAFDVTRGDLVIDLFVLRDWTVPDRAGWSRQMELYAAVYREGAPPTVQQITDLDFATASATDVYAGLWDALGPWLFEQAEGAERVFISPDAMLFQMDLLEARDAKDRRLGEVHDVYLLSDRGAYSRHDKNDQLDAEDAVALVGGVYFDNRKEEGPNYLPGSLAEVTGIADLVKSKAKTVQSLSGFEATEDRVAAMAGGAELVHLATHGFFRANDEAPFSLWNSGILLSHDGPPATVSSFREQTAYAQEIMGWDLGNVELMVLSACESGVGPNTPIDAVRGLPLALARAGARRSLVTLVEIPDQQTVDIMMQFYRYLGEEKLPYADAFLQTKRDVWAGRIDGVSPYFARAFVLYTH
ncbi:CHAT domain-containing tetratricopeptide repeat protein [Actibacterium sp. 188UL27-1]|uniref:CHAT domain-containing protein n=1 Tax=Actibacterium sp. 188UL27-1 TaxID=2786961 RepID=UPI00195D93CE|nr:CHAT domain-containing tetratricopeptide repeat protein [Actibacterium sp. 188UL27-1]MBM7067291.1 CHAT domain-containing protein [Actibacterium sp. 188UL27-1]